MGHTCGEPNEIESTAARPPCFTAPFQAQKKAARLFTTSEFDKQAPAFLMAWYLKTHHNQKV